jgi:DNA repair exonuclease SbcCD nuclease subunit
LSPDALIIAGDTFDDPQVDLPIVEDAAKSLSKLKNENGEPVSIVIIPGNHDPSEATKLWTAFRKHLGPSVHLSEQPSIIELANGKLVIEAYPCATRYSGEPPWEKRLQIPTLADHAVHVIVAHGTLVGGPVPEEDTDAYPFTQSDLEALGAHYVALGHFHSVYPVWGDGDECQHCFSYSGTHEPDQFDGDSGFALLASIIPDQGTRLARIKVGRRHWRLLRLAGPADLEHVEQLRTEIEASDDRSRFVIRLKITKGKGWPYEEVDRLGRLEETMRALGAQVERRGEVEARVDATTFELNGLPSGAVKEALISLRNELQSCGDDNRRELLAAALELGWEKLQEAIEA